MRQAHTGHAHLDAQSALKRSKCDLNSTNEETRRGCAIFTSLLDLAELRARPFFWRIVF